MGHGDDRGRGGRVPARAGAGTKMSPEEALIQLQSLLGGVQSQQTQDPYQLALSEFTAPFVHPGPSPERFSPELLRLGAAVTRGGYSVSLTGNLLYANGVIANPASQDPVTGVLYGPKEQDPDVEGSMEWLAKIRTSWNQETVNKWRKTLSDQGYEVASRGEMAQDLLNALRIYHGYRYLNQGEAIPLLPGGKERARKQLRRSTDMLALREEVKTWTQVPFGEDMKDDEAEYFTDLAMDLATRLMKQKDFTPEQALQGGVLRAQKRFIQDPNVKQALRDVEEQEVSFKLRDTILSAAELAGI